MVKLRDITWTDAEQILKETDTAILPLGATEQHGPHGPLGTDIMTAEYVSRVVGEETCLPVLPVIPVGISDHHRQFPGTLWVPPPVFREYVKAVALSASSHGVRKLVMVNGHGGNTNALYEVAEKLRMEHGIFSIIVHSYTPQMDGHAGADETSLALYIDESLIRMDRARKSTVKTELAGMQIGGNDRLGPAVFPRDTIDLSDTGIYAGAGRTIDPSKASKKRGEELIKPHIEEIVKTVQELKNIDIMDLLPKKR
jgi:creatinine amidohydrolase